MTDNVSANLMSFFSVTLLEMDYSEHSEHYFRVAVLEYCTFNVSIIILVSGCVYICIYIYTHIIYMGIFNEVSVELSGEIESWNKTII